MVGARCGLPGLVDLTKSWSYMALHASRHALGASWSSCSRAWAIGPRGSNFTEDRWERGDRVSAHRLNREGGGSVSAASK
jgi:hypothetical protein